jgi:Ca2+-binding RTX toxin-like protein
MTVLNVSSRFFSVLNETTLPTAVSLDHQVLLDQLFYSMDFTPVSLTSTSFVQTRPDGFTMTISGSGIAPVSSLAALEAAISNGIATGALDTVSITHNGTEVLHIALAASGYTITSGNQSIALTGAFVDSFDRLFELAQAVNAITALNMATATSQQRASAFNGLASFGLSGFSISDNGQVLTRLVLGTDGLTLSLAGLELSVDGTLPANLGEAVALGYEVFSNPQASLVQLLGLANLTLRSATGEVLVATTPVGLIDPNGGPVLIDGYDVTEMLGYFDPSVIGYVEDVGANFRNGLPLGAYVMGTSGNDVLSGSSVADLIYGFAGADDLRGEAGNDTIIGGAGADFLAGGVGNDVIYGDDGSDVLYLGLGNDFAGGGAGNDVIYGGAGANVIYAGLGNDSVYGGSDGDAIIGGGDGRNFLLGNDGNDSITAGAGGDFIGGGAGNDLIYGGAGADTVYAGLGNDTVGTGGGNDVIYGSAGSNVIFAGAGADSVYGGTGADEIYGGTEANMLLGNDGNDTIYAGNSGDFIGGGTGNDVLLGGDGNDVIYLGSGNDFTGGGAGNDVIYAGAGTNRIYAGFGDDTVVAGYGRDVITGGPGADHFVFASSAQIGIGAARDVITDFAPGVDKIDLSALGLHFIGAAGFSGTAGELRYIPGFVVGDINGDGVNDFAIELSGAPTLTVDDFIL